MDDASDDRSPAERRDAGGSRAAGAAASTAGAAAVRSSSGGARSRREAAAEIVGAPAEEDAELLETTIDRQVIHSGDYLTLRVDTIEDAQGHRHTREVIEHPGAVAIIALEAGDVLFVRQFRTAVGRVCLEIPAGTLDRIADGGVEDPDLAAPRELAEETGYRAGTWRHLGRFFTAPGFAEEDMHLYLATDLTAIAGYVGPGTDERLQLVRVPWRGAIEMAESGLVDDAKSILALFWLERMASRGEVSLPPG